MLFNKLASYFAKLENTASRLEKIELLSTLFQEDPQDIAKIIYLSQGTVAPSYMSVDFNIGGSLIKKALEKTFEISVTELNANFNTIGDLGDVAVALATQKGDMRETTISIAEVFVILEKIVAINGKDTIQRKLEVLVPLFMILDSESLRYVIRIVLSNLRLGFSDRTMLDALSKAFTGSTSSRKVIEGAYYRCSDLGLIATQLVDKGVDSLASISLIPLVPLFPKLVERASSMEEIVIRMKANGKVDIHVDVAEAMDSLPTLLCLQPKFDGLRAQIHKLNGEVKIFSRKLEELTDMFPELVKDALQLPYNSFILDSEVIGYNEETGLYALFQETIKRKRKYNILEAVEQIPIIANVFDVLYLDGEDLTRKAFNERFQILKKVLDSSPDEMQLRVIENIYPENEIAAEAYFTKNIDLKLEGIIAKNPLSVYDPGTRNFEWIKLKRASIKDLNDTIDCVIVGYDYGQGQRSKFGIGAILVAIFNEATDTFETIAKIGSGLKDEDLILLKKNLDTLVVSTQPKNESIDKRALPDVFVKPEIVVEIKSDEITKSVMHTAGRDENGFGYALRFPRLLKIRSDKGPMDITKVAEIQSIAAKNIS